MIGKQYVLMSPWHAYGINRNFLFRKYHVLRTRCNIIDYRVEGREGAREKWREEERRREGGRKPSETVAYDLLN